LATRRPPPAASRRIAIGGGTRIAAVFGDPVAHSLSPAMHNAAYAALAMDRAYVALHVKLDQLPAALRAIPALGLLGVNLTVPHKQAALAVVRRLSAEARLLGAANCIVNRGGVLYGDNTDARGLEQALRELGLALSGKLAIVIGAGGAAAAALLAAQRLHARRIVIVNRTLVRAQSLARRFSRVSSRIQAAGLEALRDPELMAAAAVVMNATSMGLSATRFVPLDYRATPRDCLFYDLVYAPRATPFLKPAQALGRPTADGAGMLLHQGVLAFRLFNRVPAPVDVMRRALMEQLGRSARPRGSAQAR
jgi:shikimate dehydrogenase